MPPSLQLRRGLVAVTIGAAVVLSIALALQYWLVEVATQSADREFDLTHTPVEDLAISPDGHLIATLGQGVTLTDLETGAERVHLPLTDAHAIGFGPDGLWVGGDEGLRLYDLTFQEPVRQFDYAVEDLVVLPTGGDLILMTAQGVQHIDATSGEVTLTYEYAYPGGQLALSRDGRWLAALHQELDADEQPLATHLVAWAVGGDLRFDVEADSVWLNALTFSPDGERIVAAGSNDVAFYATTDGRQLEHWEVDESYVSFSDLAYSPDGELLIAGTLLGTAPVWRDDELALKLEADSTRYIAWVPGTRTLVTAGTEDQLHIWDALEP